MHGSAGCGEVFLLQENLERLQPNRTSERIDRISQISLVTQILQPSKSLNDFCYFAISIPLLSSAGEYQIFFEPQHPS
jgi:hypothetical protein